MNLQPLRTERRKWLHWKNIAPLRQMLEALPEIDCRYRLENCITIETDATPVLRQQIYDTAWAMRPWRKGPFRIDDIFIESEWNSALKYNLLAPHFNLHDKSVADIGCNNGYYMFRMLAENPAKIVGFDPSPLFMTQFDFINRFIRSEIRYELLGVEHVACYEEKFDTIFCLGVLYHRSDPVSTLKSLKRGLNRGGELFLDTFMIDGEEEVALTPRKTYSKIPNIYFIPTRKALTNWCLRAGFRDVEEIAVTTTTPDEQRTTKWIHGESLENFLDPEDESRTIEGYPAPKRLYIRASL
ncbi:MAG TPA: tRNA 5-methoxyuridine(34)/uridine 5-oxyacetic acid(34) synthase CmoB [Campylobacteraceae bacterium]|nr:tRNA 5-methoxyuridine(34)/uridine 5-oxyacetic acid(34) synthase CmoB [Campylobacteraceae bacterium]